MIAIEDRDDILTIWLDRPQQRNALTRDMLDRIAAAATSQLGPHVRVIVLAGRGKAFCAGFDLDACRAANDGSVTRSLLEGLSRAVLALRRSRVPVVVAAHGAAIAGGCALLGGGDFVVTDAGAKLGYPAVKPGLSPAVSAPFLRLNVGDGRCREMMLDPDLIDGREAARRGLASDLVDTPEQVLPRAVQIAKELADKPPHAVRATELWLNELDEDDEMYAPAPQRSGESDLRRSRLADALAASLSIAGGPEERERLAAIWSKGS